MDTSGVGPGGSYVVVGVDGSPRSRRALDWALVEAELCHLPLVVVHAWKSAGRCPGAAASARERAERLLDREVDSLKPDSRHDPVVVLSALEGDRAPALAKAAGHASMLVLGGRNGDGRLAAECRRLAACPIVVVTAEGAHRLEPSSGVAPAGASG